MPGGAALAGREHTLLDRAAIGGATNWYRLTGTLSDGAPLLASPLAIVHAGVTAFALERLAPNPVRTTAQLSYALPQRAHVRLSVVDVQGREVAQLTNAEREAGRHVAQLDVSDLRAGLYFIRLRAAGQELRQRLVVVR